MACEQMISEDFTMKAAALLSAAETRPRYKDHPEFRPFATPKEILKLGVFDGRYFIEGKLPKGYRITHDNFFAPCVSQSLETWQAKGWIKPHDKKGWFQWYLNFHRGRRIAGYDKWQINRHINFASRHGGAVKKRGGGDLNLRARQRQSLIHWAAWPIPDLEKI